MQDHFDSLSGERSSLTLVSEANADETTPEQLQEARLARRCFQFIERLTMQIASYPPGHPAIEQSLDQTLAAFLEFFQLTDRLSVQVHPHSLKMMTSAEMVWETDEPRDYCFVLSRDGLFLIHILAGIDRHELKRFIDTLNYLLEHRANPDVDGQSLFFDANFRYISYDALDESLAALAGIDLDMRNRDTREEKELIDDLFNKAFEDKDEGESVQGNYEIRIQSPEARMRKLEIGSRQFLSLSDEQQQHIMQLRQGFIEHAELEHREGEILSAILGAHPRENLRMQATDQIGEVMSELIETPQPWEALTFLKIIHQWRDKFDPAVTQDLKSVVSLCFNLRNIQNLIRQVTQASTKERRMILQMFDALHLDEATEQMALVVGWNMSDEAREDILRYLKKRSQHQIDFLEKALHQTPDEYSAPVLDMLEEAMPRSRDILVRALSAELTPPLKARALQILRGTWEEQDPRLVRDHVVPLVKSSHSPLRLAACYAVAEATPAHIVRVMTPLFNDQLRQRDDEEIRELAQIFVKHGGPEAVKKLKELVQRRGITTSEQERELAVTVARALIRTPHPSVIAMLDEVSKDWLVPQRIRSTCKEIADMLKTGS